MMDEVMPIVRWNEGLFCPRALFYIQSCAH